MLGCSLFRKFCRGGMCRMCYQSYELSGPFCPSLLERKTSSWNPHKEYWKFLLNVISFINTLKLDKYQENSLKNVFRILIMPNLFSFKIKTLSCLICLWAYKQVWRYILANILHLSTNLHITAWLAFVTSIAICFM